MGVFLPITILATLLVPIGIASNVDEPDSSPSCRSDSPTLTDRNGKEVWLNTDELVKRATYCEPPGMPPLSRSLRVEGYVFVDILVDEQGKVACARVVRGHPMFIPGAIETVKNWTFRPERIKGKAVSFRGHLRFHFSTGYVPKDEPRCTVGHR